MTIFWTTGADRMEAHFSKEQWPWRKANKPIFKEFCEWLGKTNTAAIKAGMSPYRAGLGYVINCEKTSNDLEKLEAAWDEFDALRIQQAVNREVRSKTIHFATSSAPPVIDLDDIKDRRVGVLRNMVKSGREAEALELVNGNPDWGIEWSEVKK